MWYKVMECHDRWSSECRATTTRRTRTARKDQEERSYSKTQRIDGKTTFHEVFKSTAMGKGDKSSEIPEPKHADKIVIFSRSIGARATLIGLKCFSDLRKSFYIRISIKLQKLTNLLRILETYFLTSVWPVFSGREKHLQNSTLWNLMTGKWCEKHVSSTYWVKGQILEILHEWEHGDQKYMSPSTRSKEPNSNRYQTTTFSQPLWVIWQHPNDILKTRDANFIIHVGHDPVLSGVCGLCKGFLVCVGPSHTFQMASPSTVIL